MGTIYSLIKDALESFSTVHDAKVLMLGLDAAGKTTVLYKLKLNETVVTIPTLGFNVETVQPTKNVSFTVWDVGGQKILRDLWKHYYQGCDGLLFIVDSADHERFSEAREELQSILKDEHMFGVPVLVMANKQDLPQALGPSEVANKLGLSIIKDRDWRVQGTTATNGDGVYEAILEFSDMVRSFQKNRR